MMGGSVLNQCRPQIKICSYYIANKIHCAVVYILQSKGHYGHQGNCDYYQRFSYSVLHYLAIGKW